MFEEADARSRWNRSSSTVRNGRLRDIHRSQQQPRSIPPRQRSSTFVEQVARVRRHCDRYPQPYLDRGVGRGLDHQGFIVSARKVSIGFRAQVFERDDFAFELPFA
jgi:hypothetical protein